MPLIIAPVKTSSPNLVPPAAFCLIAVLLFLPALAQVKPQPAEARSPNLHWEQQAGVKRYRLQIAADEHFRDVRVDRLVLAEQYRPADLPPGRYYWRVAPSETGLGTFIRPDVFEIGTINRLRAEAPPAKPAAKPAAIAASWGWMAVTGPLEKLVNAGASNLLAVNSQNTVYMFDGRHGVAQWSTRTVSGVGLRDSGFNPLIIQARGQSLIIIPFDEGLRALNSQTGRAVWTTALPNRPNNAVAATGAGSDPQLFALDSCGNELYILDAAGGHIQREVKLKVRATGPVVSAPGIGLLVSGKNNLELLSLEGNHVRLISIDSEITTPPIVVKTSRGTLLFAGTRNGLAAFDLAPFKPLARVTFEKEDYPVGVLSVTDIDGDGSDDVLATTNRGSVAAINAGRGTIKWITKSVTNGSGFAIADMNRDGRPDLVLPGIDRFAVALSGIDGAIIWKSEDISAGAIRGSSLPRVLVTLKTSDGQLVLAGSDPQGVGLKALDASKGTQKQ